MTQTEITGDYHLIFHHKSKNMKIKNLFNILSLVAVLLFISNISTAQKLNGDLHFWQKSDFLGFDDVGDCQANSGDISSVYARTENDKLLLRVTFNDMVERGENVVVNDRFLNSGLSLQLLLENDNDKTLLLNHGFDLGKLQLSDKGIYQSRTPGLNLWEAEIELNKTVAREALHFTIAIVKEGIVVDEFISDGSTSRAEGNCAFVHHGNQGITYTEVFYGSPGGQSGLDGSGFDEVLQVHEATDVPGNFHMSGTLMPAAQWHNPEFNDWLHTLASEGLIEMMTSALGQQIMPFVHNNMNDWSVGVESDMVDFQYDYEPRTAWVPERVWLAPGAYPESGVIDWLGDNWAQHGVWGVVLDDGPHLNGYDNRKIHWMNNGSGVDLRVIAINNSFVGNMHYNANGAKNQIAGMGQYNICVYGTDWEVAAEMNEHDGTFFLDNYESVLWWCHDNYPGVNVWKLVDAMQNPNFNGTGAEITNGTYGLLGGGDGYGGSNNSWYSQWAATSSESDYHDPKWNYGYIWNDAYNNLMTAPDNNLAQLAWYILMINLHETGWHDGGQVAGWEHRYSAHIKNANVYAEAARWADGQYEAGVATYYNDIDHDGVDEVVMHNQDIFAVFESIGARVTWLFYKDGLGNAHSVVGSDMAYWSETSGDYNEGSANHFAALSEVSPNQQHSIYDINILQSSGDTVRVDFSIWGINKQVELTADVNFLDVLYTFSDGDGYIKSGWSPGLMDLLWSGKDHLQRVWGDNASYCGQRNSASGATVAMVLGNGGAQHVGEFEGTLVKGDEIKGSNNFKTRLFAGYTSDPTGTTVPELNNIASDNMDVAPPQLNPAAFQIDNNTIELVFNEAVEFNSAQDKSNYSLQLFSNTYTIINTLRQPDWRKVHLTIQEDWVPGDAGQVIVENVEDLNGNIISDNNTASFTVPSGTTPHTIFIDGTNDFDANSELMDVDQYSLYITWDNEKLYVGFHDLDLNGGGDLFVNIDTDQVNGSGASGGSWGRVSYSSKYEAEYQVAIEGGGGSIQFNHFANGQWHYPGNNNCDSYEGWADNPYTEISIPWAIMGNPDGVALSVHVSEEESQMVPATFPLQNPTGDHPTLTHVYAIYPPYVSSNLPVVGMEPNAAFVLPNEPPSIDSYLPAELSLNVETGNTINFSVLASDPEDDTLYYSWTLDDEEISTDAGYTFIAEAGMSGTYELAVTVSDNIPGHESDPVSWQVEVDPGSSLIPDFSTDVTTICIDGSIQFTDLSSGEILNWLWEFESGVPNTSSDQNPLVHYQTAGTCNVSLTISNNEVSQTLLIEDYITVNDLATVVAGDDQGICADELATLTGNATFFSSILWTSTGDGVFSNASALNTTYNPGQQDIALGYVDLTLTAYPLTPCPASASDMLSLTIESVPLITLQPQGQAVDAGTDVTFTIAATSSSTILYQWYGPDGLIDGALTNEIIIYNVDAGDAGDYYCVCENICGETSSEPATLNINEVLQQSIQLFDGWSGISSYVVPADPLTENIFSEIVGANGLVVLQNYSYVYWPGQQINTIDLNGGWDNYSGYQLKVDGDHQVVYNGIDEVSKTLSYEAAGWYLIPVLNECGAAPEDLFADVIDNLVIVKEIAGTMLFWPGVYQNLFTLETGKAYAAKFDAPLSFNYPDCEVLKTMPIDNAEQVFSLHNTNCIPTPLSHSLVFEAGATSKLKPGDKISISNLQQTVSTEIEIIIPGEAIGLQLFGDDPSTRNLDGLEDGQQLLTRVIRNGEIIQSELKFYSGWDQDTFKTDGMSLVKSMDISNNTSNELISIYPNPVLDKLYFSDASDIHKITIFAVDGTQVVETKLYGNEYNVSQMKKGLYYLKIHTSGTQQILKFIKQ
jgi:PKD repeat protein